MLKMQNLKNQLENYQAKTTKNQLENKITYYLKKYGIDRKAIIKSLLKEGAHKTLFCQIETKTEFRNIWIENL